MLNPKELMLGNWVYESERSKFPMQVVNIDKDMVYLDFDSNEGDVFDGRMQDICPIPLTEEILIKNGFEFDRENSIYEIIRNHDYGLCLKKKDDSFYIIQGYEVIFEISIKYVHHLQNILTIAGIDIELKI